MTSKLLEEILLQEEKLNLIRLIKLNSTENFEIIQAIINRYKDVKASELLNPQTDDRLSRELKDATFVVYDKFLMDQKNMNAAQMFKNYEIRCGRCFTGSGSRKGVNFHREMYSCINVVSGVIHPTSLEQVAMLVCGKVWAGC
jgi:hypothetical protein